MSSFNNQDTTINTFSVDPSDSISTDAILPPTRTFFFRGTPDVNIYFDVSIAVNMEDHDATIFSN